MNSTTVPRWVPLCMYTNIGVVNRSDSLSSLFTITNKVPIWHTNEKRRDHFKLFVDQILTEWKDTTMTKLTPKCHMLLHMLPFVKNFDYLGKYNESQLESFHGQFFYKQKIHHFNQNNEKEEQLRRTLADFTLKAIVHCKLS